MRALSSARIGAAGICLAAPLYGGACDKGPSATTEGEVVRPPGEVVCQKAPEDASVVVRPGEGCPLWFRVGEDGSVEVGDLADGSTRAGSLPFAVSRADFEPVVTRHGLVVIISELAPDSEVPLSVGALYPNGDAMGYATLWDRRLGDDSVGDNMSLGPPFGLAPVDCEAGIGFTVGARLPSASEEAPSEAIATRAGLYGEGGRVGPLPDDCKKPLTPPL